MDRGSLSIMFSQSCRLQVAINIHLCNNNYNNIRPCRWCLVLIVMVVIALVTLVSLWLPFTLYFVHIFVLMRLTYNGRSHAGRDAKYQSSCCDVVTLSSHAVSIRHTCRSVAHRRMCVKVCKSVFSARSFFSRFSILLVNTRCAQIMSVCQHIMLFARTRRVAQLQNALRFVYFNWFMLLGGGGIISIQMSFQLNNGILRWRDDVEAERPNQLLA